MPKVIIMGSGAAPGVPSLAKGWGKCDPNNPKNCRLRAGIKIEYGNTNILIDTSPDLRHHLLTHNILNLDAVLLTHAHADHLHGLDDLREVNRVCGKAIDFYATENNILCVQQRFGYMLTNTHDVPQVRNRGYIIPHVIECDKPFFINDVKIEPISLEGHNQPSTGYVFNDGEIVVISDCENIADYEVDKLKNSNVKIMIMPLTCPSKVSFHMGLEEIINYAKIIKPEKIIINHMAVECDYDTLCSSTPDFVEIAYDGFEINLEK